MPKRKTTETSASGPVRRKKLALGRGLGALIPEIEDADERPRDFFYCDITLIRPNRFQPRLSFPKMNWMSLANRLKNRAFCNPC